VREAVGLGFVGIAALGFRTVFRTVSSAEWLWLFAHTLLIGFGKEVGRGEGSIGSSYGGMVPRQMQLQVEGLAHFALQSRCLPRMQKAHITSRR
jgi:hypothetical protein